MAAYVDDTLTVGDRIFDQLTNATEKKFDANEKKYNKIRFAGVYIEKQDEEIIIH